MTSHFIEPHWPAPPRVRALTTLRTGGCSRGPYESFNLGDHVGDSADDVAANRHKLYRLLPADTQVQWLNQVHGAAVVEAGAQLSRPDADGSFSRRPGVACAVLTADCLPLLLCSVNGDVVAAVHAGWRGLCAGVLEAAVEAMSVPSKELLAWLGPAIGPRAFEVGPEVRGQFMDAAGARVDAVQACFVPSERTAGHYLADLYALARQRLESVGVERIFGGGRCTFSDRQRFFSHRRDGQTGRMATLIMLQTAQSRT